MKKSMLVLLIGMIGITGLAQKQEEKAIQATIEGFAKAADNNDVAELSKYLDANYRVVMNQLFGSADVSVVTHDEYVAKIESKEWGGDKRKVEVQQIMINGNTAVAHATLTGEKMTFKSLFMLVKDKDGNWKLVSDTPTI